MIQILFLLICFIGYKISAAQSDYVVTTKGDTIQGKVKYLNYGVEKKVQVITDAKKDVYSILQTKGFKMENEVYHTVRYGQGYTYMKLVTGGYLSLYAFQEPNEVTWDGNYLLKRDGGNLEVPNIGFKKNLKKFMDDCPVVAARIEAGEFSRSEISKIVDAYNQCIDQNTQNKNQAPPPLKEVEEKLKTWNQLETKVKDLDNFDRKINSLEMIQEIKLKISNGEKIPNFLKEGLTDALKDQSSVQGLLENALNEIKN